MIIFYSFLLFISLLDSILFGAIIILLILSLFLFRQNRQQSRSIQQLKYDTLILEQKVKIKEDEIKGFKADMDVQKVLKKELLRSLQNAVEQENITSVKKSLYALITQFRCQIYKNVG